MADNLDRISRSVTVIGAIIAAGVALNTLITTRATQAASNYQAFRGAVAAEDARWRGLYDDYLGTFTKDYADNPELQARKRAALNTIAERDVASFVEFDVPAREKAYEHDRINKLRLALIGALTDPRADDRATAEARQQESFNAGIAEKPVQQGAAAVQPPARDGAPLPTAPVVLSRANPSGWDIDVFWCRGTPGRDDTAAAANHATASALGNAFAAFSRDARPLVPGVRLGRVQLKPLTPEQQARHGVTRSLVSWDNSPGEFEAAGAVQRLVNGAIAPTAPQFALARNSYKPSQWYISVFVCPAQAE